jgi:hypothetical protein
MRTWLQTQGFVEVPVGSWPAPSSDTQNFQNMDWYQLEAGEKIFRLYLQRESTVEVDYYDARAWLEVDRIEKTVPARPKWLAYAFTVEDVLTNLKSIGFVPQEVCA